MIGVLADKAEAGVINEFFELFKTPWQFYDVNLEPDVLICTGGQPANTSARLVIIYGTEPGMFDREKEFEPLSNYAGAILSYREQRVPIYGQCLTFRNSKTNLLRHARTNESAACQIASANQTIVRIGYDLFDEVRCLLKRGQPIANAAIPTLELHIAILRDLIKRSSIPLVEIPPVPAGYQFVVCLTHDIDQPGIRQHRFDRTILGFLYRALLGSCIHFCKRRRSLKFVGRNWLAALSLPLVYLGLARDFWSRFDRYLEIEHGFPSTFFLIARKGDPGHDCEGRTSAARAAKYGLSDIRDQIQCLSAAGSEIGLHGIDAWFGVNQGRSELDAIRQATGIESSGVRMHWLFFAEDSPSRLEEAGFRYDSTLGYNETIGYRAGTTQVFKPLGVKHLSELPMHIMDTALFLPSRMNLSFKKAKEIIHTLLADFDRFGGALTVNWHDRSIAPERLWDDAYVDLLEECKGKGVWFAKADDAVSWFQQRRSATFEPVTDPNGRTRIKVSADPVGDKLPGLRLRVHTTESEFTDTCFNDLTEVELESFRSPRSALRNS